ncbi:glucosaminidase domain-containing protein [Ferrimonas gelatinilytica]|uniref:Glucosaminidase domain-containing protein n=1 Tax=Ferrimonas gelatinilytica TaxID=1255257 RepID=A0ABP9RXR6_9GAMM
MRSGRIGRITLGLAAVALAMIVIQTSLPPEVTSSSFPRLEKNPTRMQAPDFSLYTDVQAKKAAFFGFLRPLVAEENQKILAQRQWLNSVLERVQAGKTLDSTEEQRLTELAEDYRYELRHLDEESLKALLERVDEVPEDMVLIQAANESGWGTSRFAVEGNNYFGQWCFSKGCGLVPNSRDSGLSHEVAKFADPRASVAAYLLNINTNGAYDDLRDVRRGLRKAGQPVTAEDLIPTLIRYSERREAYVAELLQMLGDNHIYL